MLLVCEKCQSVFYQNRWQPLNRKLFLLAQDVGFTETLCLFCENQAIGEHLGRMQPELLDSNVVAV